MFEIKQKISGDFGRPLGIFLHKHLVKIYTTTGSLAQFENRNIKYFLLLGKLH
jgi:hypothetical protein